MLIYRFGAPISIRVHVYLLFIVIFQHLPVSVLNYNECMLTNKSRSLLVLVHEPGLPIVRQRGQKKNLEQNWSFKFTSTPIPFRSNKRGHAIILSGVYRLQ